jgi:hypothetical protein
MPQLHYNKRKEDEEAQVKGENWSVERSKNMAIYITSGSIPDMASSCTSYTELNEFFYTVKTAAVHNPYLQH